MRRRVRGLFFLPLTFNMSTEMFAKKTKTYGIAMQTSGFEVCGFPGDSRSQT
jgi:hypothetical protein